MSRLLFYALALALGVVIAVAVASTGVSEPAPPPTTDPDPVPPPPTTTTPPTVSNPIESAQVNRLERKLTQSRRAHRRDRYRYRRALQVLIHASPIGEHPIERSFLCIHSGEGRWADPNPPYYGGLQMDLNFQRAYGREFLRAFGTADHWPISVQVAVAIRAVLAGRGFYPWPNTARVCGLIR